ncbi:MAG TPA: hypothetical protein VFE78_14080 [Gemmataceae bacterium]|jgi:hypothetical protein|nr:hypothetical protein [Gemmataceae bacterium]
MNEREHIEGQIHQVLASETQAIPLSDKLFGPEGLFGRLAGTEEERRAVSLSPLFRQAQQRLTELQRKEAAEFSQVAQQAHVPTAEGAYWLKLERSEGT